MFVKCLKIDNSSGDVTDQTSWVNETHIVSIAIADGKKIVKDLHGDRFLVSSFHYCHESPKRP